MFDELKNFLERFFEKEVFFFCGMLAIQSDTYWCKMSSNLQNLFWSPYVKRFSQRSQIGEIKIIQILLFIVWSLKLIAPKNLLLSLHQNFDNVLLHGVNVCTQYLPSNRRLSIMFTIPISYYWLHSGFHNNCDKISTCPPAHEKVRV